MYTDHKQKRASKMEMQQRNLMPPRFVDQEALGRFKAKSYQQEFAEKIEKARNKR